MKVGWNKAVNKKDGAFVTEGIADLTRLVDMKLRCLGKVDKLFGRWKDIFRNEYLKDWKLVEMKWRWVWIWYVGVLLLWGGESIKVNNKIKNK